MAKIKQGYEHYLKLMINIFVLQGWKVQCNMLVIDSYDGAVHSSTNKKDSGIVSYSTLLFHSDYFAHGVSSASSSCILTWMNSLTAESRETLFPLLIPIFSEQALLRSKTSFHDGSNFWYYQMHDAKFSYTLTAHVGWSSKKSPFLLCGCNRGEGVGNEKHECKLITDEEQLILYNASAKHWETIKTKH